MVPKIFVTILRFKNKMKLRNMHGLVYVTQINLPLFTEMKRFIKYAIEHLEVLHPHTRKLS